MFQAAPGPLSLQNRRDLCYLVLAGLFLGTMGMLNIHFGLTRFLSLARSPAFGRS